MANSLENLLKHRLAGDPPPPWIDLIDREAQIDIFVHGIDQEIRATQAHLESLNLQKAALQKARSASR